MPRGYFQMQVGITRIATRVMVEPDTVVEMNVALDGRGNRVVVRELSATQLQSSFTSTARGDFERTGQRAVLTLTKIDREVFAGRVIDIPVPHPMYPPSHVDAPPVRHVSRATLRASVATASGDQPNQISSARFVAAHAYIDESD